MRSGPLGPGPEFDLIRSLIGEGVPPHAAVAVGPGDDCVVLEGGLVISCDLSVEDVHFRRGWMSMDEVGYRSTAAALSDLAAMAATPIGALLALALPPDDLDPTAADVAEGAKAACREAGVGIQGGDVARSRGGLLLDVVVFGMCDRPVLRSGCRPGHEVWVTGSLGAPAAAITCLTRGDTPTPELRDAFVHPNPRIEEALWLAERVHLGGLIDLSDGLAGDAGHLAASSGVAMVLEEDRIPIHAAVPRDAGSEVALAMALTGGEDYELCFSAAPGTVGGLASEFQERFGLALARVGKVEEGEGVRIVSASGEERSLVGGFSHFSQEESS